MPTDTSEKGLESLITKSLIDKAGWTAGSPNDFDREHAIDFTKLSAFLQKTQPKTFEQLGFDSDNAKRRQFLARLQGEIAKRGVVDVLRNGLKHGELSITLFYGTP